MRMIMGGEASPARSPRSSLSLHEGNDHEIAAAAEVMRQRRFASSLPGKEVSTRAGREGIAPVRSIFPPRWRSSPQGRHRRRQARNRP